MSKLEQREELLETITEHPSVPAQNRLSKRKIAWDPLLRYCYELLIQPQTLPGRL